MVSFLSKALLAKNVVFNDFSLLKLKKGSYLTIIINY